MERFDSFEEGVEVNGKMVLSFVEGVPPGFEDKAARILADNGIDDPSPVEWYAQQDWLDAFRDLNEDVGQVTLRQIGRKVPETAAWPSNVDSLTAGLESIGNAYEINHRGGDTGHFEVEQDEDYEVRIGARTPYPCAFERGMIKAVADRYSSGIVPELHETGDECRREGGRTCAYKITW